MKSFLSSLVATKGSCGEPSHITAKEGLLSFTFFSINSNALFTIISDEVPLNSEIFPLSAKMGLMSKKLVTLNHLSNPNSPGPYSSSSKIGTPGPRIPFKCHLPK